MKMPEGFEKCDSFFYNQKLFFFFLGGGRSMVLANADTIKTIKPYVLHLINLIPAAEYFVSHKKLWHRFVKAEI